MFRQFDPADLGIDAERGALLAEVFGLHGRVHDRALARVGPMPNPTELTMQQRRVLGFVAKEPGMAGHELGTRLSVSAPTASGLVDRLVEKGLLTRSDDAEDRRVRRLHITDTGLEVVRQLDSLIERAMISVIQMMTLDDLQKMRDSSLAMLAAMDRADANARQPE